MRQMKKKIGILFTTIMILIATAGTGLIKSETAQAVKASSPYQIKVNRIYNTVTVYGKDSKGAYTVPVKAMLCSVGINLEGTNGFTPTGSYNTSAKYRWRALFGDVFGQYATRITGNILFHSVYYTENNRPDTLNAEEFNKLGERASKGCIRLSCADAKWIYDNCPIGTNVVIYDDEESAGPLGKPDAIKIPMDSVWDPTDPSNLNPYKKLLPSIEGARNQTVEAGVAFDPLEGVTAYSTTGMDITDKIEVQSKVDENKPGKYKLTYSITDAIGKKYKETVTIIVNDNEIIPRIEGTSDKYISEGRKLSKAFLLSGIEAYYGTRKYRSNEIDISYKKSDDDTYEVSYTVTGDNEMVVTKTSYVHIDREAPFFVVNSDEFFIDDFDSLTKEAALAYVMVQDNYSTISIEDVSVSFDYITEDVVFVTYQAQDEVGNIATKSIKFIKR